MTACRTASYRPPLHQHSYARYHYNTPFAAGASLLTLDFEATYRPIQRQTCGQMIELLSLLRR